MTMMTTMKLALVAAATLGAAQGAQAESTLKQVVVLSRHGVRGPYGLGTDVPSQEIFDQYVRNPDVQLPLRAVDWGTSETDDPSEIVSPKLTKHGYKLVEIMGNYFRKHLYEKFIQDTPCAQLFAYADANQRDNLTAKAFLEGAFTTCKDALPITGAGTRLLFEQGQDPTATCPVCSRTVYNGIAGAPDCRYLVHENRKEIHEINHLLGCCAPPVCGIHPLPETPDNQNASHPKCSFFDIPSVWSGAFYQPWKDPLSSAEYFTEFLMLQALNNMTLPWHISFEKVKELSRVHEAHMDLVTNDINSANFGATLLAHITASFEQRATGKNISLPANKDGPLLDPGADNRFLFYAGHDINILYLRKLLRLQWFTRGWHPHQPTPGGMLIFELHERGSKDAGGTDASSTSASISRHRLLSEPAEAPAVDHHFVKAFFVTATPEQMRHGESLSRSNSPDIVPVIIPFCSEDELQADGSTLTVCPFDKFKTLIGKMLKHECVADSLRPFVDSLDSGGGSKPSGGSGSGLHLIMWLLFVVLLVVFLVVVARHLLLQNRRAHESSSKAAYGTLPQVASD